jgi:Domain of unknown function (DUF892)
MDGLTQESGGFACRQDTGAAQHGRDRSGPTLPERAGVVACCGNREEFLKEHPPEAVLTMFDLGAASKTEHYEIASYRGLIEKARLMGQQHVVQLLEQNLRQEEEMAEKVSQLSRELGRQQISQVMSATQTQAQSQTLG